MGYRGYAEVNGFIVAPPLDNTGDFTSIQAAINAAVAAGGTHDIFIKDGTYVEDLTLQPGINLLASPSSATTGSTAIQGTLSYSGSGRVTIHSLTLLNNGSNPVVNVSGAVQSQLTISNCFLPLTADGIIFSSSVSSSFVVIDSCTGYLANGNSKFFDSSSAGSLNIQYTEIGNFGAGATIASICSGTGAIGIDFCYLFFPINYTSSNVASHITHSTFEISSVNKVAITTTGTGAISCFYCIFSSGTASCFSIGMGTQIEAAIVKFTTQNANAVTGAGLLVYGILVFDGNHGITGVSQSPLFVKTGNVFLGGSQQVASTVPGSYPYTIVPDQDYYILADSSGGPVTVNLPATPNGGDSYVVKDATGSTDTNAITVSGNGNNIDGVASLNIINNYASFTFIFNGTQWNSV